MKKQLSAWIQASRLPSQLFIFFPILLGQAAWVSQGGSINWRAFVLIQLFGLFDQLYIVYANDYADYRDDRLNTAPTIFSGGSRVLVDNLLKPVQLKTAAIIMIVLCITTGILFTLLYRYYYMIPLMASGILLLWMYSYRPFKLSYRGGGELLQTAGTGFGLPLLGYYAQSGNLSSFPWIVLLIILPTSLSCAIATALPDRPADVHYSKRTFPVLVGLSRAKIAIFILNIISIVAAFVIIHPLNSRFLDYSIRLLPVGAFVGLIIFGKALPGTPKITAFVSMAVITTLSLIAGVTLSMFGC